MRKIVELIIIYNASSISFTRLTLCFYGISLSVFFFFVKVGVLGEVESYAKVLYEISSIYIYIYFKPSNKRNVTNTD